MCCAIVFFDFEYCFAAFVREKVAVADVDGDHELEMLVGDTAGMLYCVKEDGTECWKPAVLSGAGPCDVNILEPFRHNAGLVVMDLTGVPVAMCVQGYFIDEGRGAVRRPWAARHVISTMPLYLYRVRV